MLHFNGYSNFHDLNLDYLLQQITVLKNEMAEIETWHDEWVDKLEELENEYNRIVLMYDTLEADFVQFKQDVNNDFARLRGELIADIEEAETALQNQINAFRNEVNFQLNGFQNEITALNIKLDNAIEHFADNLYIINPFTGQNESISEVIQMLASFHMEDAITAGEYDALSLTAANYDARSLTAYQYDVLAKQYLL